jgi:hypothetical protein
VANPDAGVGTESKIRDAALVVLAWLPVLLPLAWGIWQTVKKASVLFTAT